MAPMPASPPVIIGHWQLYPATGELVRLSHSPLPESDPAEASSSELPRSDTQRLEPKVVELLLLLAESPGAVVSRDQIMDRLWPKTIVGDDTLARTVSKLRKSLGDDGKQQHYIETLSKRGYRLIAAVQRQQAVVAAVETAIEKTVDQTGGSTDEIPREPSAALSASTARINTNSTNRLSWGKLTVAAVFAVALLSFAWLRLTEPSLDANRRQADQNEQVLDDGRQASEQVAARANDFYFQFSRPGNESAIALFEQLVASKPHYAPGYAGLANALVQKVIRWQGPPTAVAAEGGRQPPAADQPDYSLLASAIKSGHTRSENARQLLARAEQLALHAVTLAPRDAESWKALGFVYSAQERFDLALSTYQKAVQADPNAWSVLINVADVMEITGRGSEALSYLEAAHAAMTRVYASQSARMLPWYAELGVLIGDRHRARGDVAKAEHWYRRVLDYAPLQPAATGRMAQLRWQAGDHDGAKALCAELQQRVGETAACKLPM